jgi:hypothetical protein
VDAVEYQDVSRASGYYAVTQLRSVMLGIFVLMALCSIGRFPKSSTPNEPLDQIQHTTCDPSIEGEGDQIPD